MSTKTEHTLVLVVFGITLFFTSSFSLGALTYAGKKFYEYNEEIESDKKKAEEGFSKVEEYMNTSGAIQTRSITGSCRGKVSKRGELYFIFT